MSVRHQREVSISPATPMEREFWHKHASIVPKPIYAASNLLPIPLIYHLIFHKSIVAVKQKHNHKITPLQGACHSLLVPIVFPVFMDKVTNYRNSTHVLDPLPLDESPFVVLSALVQPDFEFKDVMYELIRLELQPVKGMHLDKTTNNYSDFSLKRHMVFHFTKSHQLPATLSVTENELSSGQYMAVDNDILSIEMLRNLIKEQLRIEMVALTYFARKFDIKLAYTWDPPSIFAKTIGLETLDRLWMDAVTDPGILSPEIQTIGYNDFFNKSMVQTLQERLNVKVSPKHEIRLNPGHFKVLHSNSDAFGQHIRTQPAATSLDGAIGSCSSASASLFTPYPPRILWVEKGVS